jgi:cell division transport system ATP-binding protein
LTLFEEIHEAGTTVVFATHDHSLLQSAPHRLVVIDEGRVIEVTQGLAAWSARGTRTVGAAAGQRP